MARTPDGMVLSQRKYTMDILADSGHQGYRPSSFPTELNAWLDHAVDSSVVDVDQCQWFIGRLLYLHVTQPDITFAVNNLSQFVSSPRKTHLDAAQCVLRYLKSTHGQGIFFLSKGDLSLSAFCDLDWLFCPLTRRSKTCYFIILGGAPISWNTKKQFVVSRSSVEVEYRAMATTVNEILWLRWLLRDLEAPQPGPTTLYYDNQATRQIANNPIFQRIKHVEMDCYFVRERVESGDIQPLPITTVNHVNQVANIFTKPLGADHFHFLLGKMGVRNLHDPS